MNLIDVEPRRVARWPRWLSAILAFALTACSVGTSAKSATIGSEQDVKFKVDSFSTIVEENIYHWLAIYSADNPTNNVMAGRMLVDDPQTPNDDQIPVDFSIQPGTTDNLSIKQKLDRYMDGVVTSIELNGAKCLKSQQIEDVYICPTK